MADPLVVALGAAVAGAAVNQAFNAWRESRSRGRDQAMTDLAELRADVRAMRNDMTADFKAMREDVTQIREHQAGIAAVVDAMVVAPRDNRPGRGR